MNEDKLPVISWVFEQYEFKNWLITIENYRATNELMGFATPTRYAHLLDAGSTHLIDEIAQENGIESKIDEYGDEYYEDFKFIIAQPDDIVVNFLAKVNTKKSSCVLEYMVNEIISELDIEHPSTIVLKQVYKKSITPKVGKRKTGFLHQAWAALVKDRDKKCTECGSVYDLHAHHIKQYKSHPELKNDVNNGITLCGPCHRKWHLENGK
jgi:5-methylcytosine-specific restriction endonuclease McrA